MNFSEQELAIGRKIIETCRDLERRGLNQGTSGNVSVRLGRGTEDGFLITPTAMPYDIMQPEDMAHMRFDGGRSGRHEPSSEWRFHLDIYRTRPEVGAVVHTHSGYATTLACLRRGIPAFHYMIALFGGNDIRCCDYATYGTQELSDLVVKALAGRNAALMGNHGLIVLGPDLQRALALTIEAETLAMMYWRAVQLGEPRLLPDAEIARVLEKFAAYGYSGPAQVPLTAEIQLTDDTFDKEVLESNSPVLVDFWAPWCGPCGMLTPVIKEIAKEYAGKVKVGKLNTDEQPNAPGRFRISAIPTILFFKGGKMVETRVGVQSKADIKKLLDGLLA